ncbi:MAG: TIM barrel protein [Candidatus Brocadiaceae bacterium]|nr:TIM barrel protein [Candidatus Brocadiaceae bacterium]
MSRFRIGCVPITWKNVPQDQVLREIVESGYEGVPAGPRGGMTARGVLDELYGYGLDPAPTYMGGDLWTPEAQEPALEQAARLAAFAREADVTELFISAGGSRTFVGPRGLNRMRVAGRVEPSDAMSDAEYRQLADTLNRIGEITRAEDVRLCYHNHCASVIETREEIERLLSLVDPDLVFLGPDTGHLAWGGTDVVEFFREHADRILAVHLKDIDPRVMMEGRSRQWDYAVCREQGIYTELGEGFVDFPGVLEALRAADYRGWLLAETDVTQLPTAYESAVVSRDYLESLGL